MQYEVPLRGFEFFELELECGHTIRWKEGPADPGADLPYVGRIVWCPACKVDREVEEVLPERVVFHDIPVSEEEPSQTSFPGGMSYTAGERARVFYDARTGSYGYYFYGVSREGLAYESDAMLYFESLEDALGALEYVLGEEI